ncbi:MAG: RagB/SusD family nutrient uptake outer membrane protein [Bacteroidales bacterium]
MRKSIIYILAFLAISCQDVLDKKNLGAIDGSYVWGDPNLIQLNVNSFYENWMPNGFDQGRIYQDGIITDEGRSGLNGRGVNILNGVRFAADRTDVPYQVWNYSGIRKANEFLENIKRYYVLPSNAGQVQIQKRNRFIGEVKFFRALMYWEMIKVYGGVPIITNVIDKNETNLLILYPKRNTTDECFEFIINELKESAQLLSESYSDDDWGRITSGAALSFCGRIQLFRASPLFNPSDDVKYWKDAYDTYMQVVSMGVYDLHSNFASIWADKGSSNKEVILFRDFKKGVKTHGWDAANKMISQAVGDLLAICPSQELVDAFPMIDGTPYLKKSPEVDPYVGRDPRLRASVVWNGDIYGPQKKSVFTYITPTTDPKDPRYNIDGLDNLDKGTSTGYFMRKMIDETLDGSKGDFGYGRGSFTQWIEIRYAEVLLGLAEAANEIGESTVAIDQLKKIRIRAGINSGENDSYGISNGLNKDELRSLIQNERYIELAFECKRYWDLRRWKLAHINLSRQLTAMQINKLDDGSFKYTRRIQRHDKTNMPVFLEKFYILPLPKGELLKNSNLEQNENWK